MIDLGGFIPGWGIGFDLANAFISGVRGDYLRMSLSLAAAVPLAGDAVMAIKMGRNAIRATEAVAETARVIEKASDLGRTAEAVAETARVIEKTSDLGRTARTIDAAAGVGRVIKRTGQVLYAGGMVVTAGTGVIMAGHGINQMVQEGEVSWESLRDVSLGTLTAFSGARENQRGRESFSIGRAGMMGRSLHSDRGYIVQCTASPPIGDCNGHPAHPPGAWSRLVHNGYAAAGNSIQKVRRGGFRHLAP